MKIPLLALLLGSSALKVGDRAPDFTLPDTEGHPVTLSKLLEKGPVVLAFYIKAFTPGWTREVQAYRDRYAELAGRGGQVVGISTDSVETQRRFKEKYQLPFPLLSDQGGKVAKQYGGTMPIVGLANRATFVVDRDGKVKQIVEGQPAVDPGGAIAACTMPEKGTP